ncbi:class I SAM-dependent methyltransferase [Microlunatus parietis]|uniref:Ubiquinone/menaquinone biosynthesis C-methylase UbiE n=1 Tax=Microlunatus parietis TaxID=682979 RepID=A0A7Y9LA70_9ACTN|nr:class I SAM-dependent methyltransferase [Microlunatus parietis]NYE69345.1 ubiquinone/menaquinone biosynthesis C-methylase UbiE [Microlunatus parietis]
MADQVHEHRHFIPAMGQQRFLPVYDLTGWLAGVPRMHRSLLDQAAIGAGMAVLEIGCGTGNLIIRAARRHPGATFTGLDPDRIALANAERKVARRRLSIRFDVGYADALPYPDGSQDRVLSSLMFHHLDEAGKDGALREAFRVLRPGGELHLLDFTGGGHGRLPERIRDAADERIPDRLRSHGFTEVARTGDVKARWGFGTCSTFRGVRPA